MHMAHGKMDEWQRLYSELGAARQRLAVAGRCGGCDEKTRLRLQAKVNRLQRESDAALRALHEAVALNGKTTTH